MLTRIGLDAIINKLSRGQDICRNVVGKFMDNKIINSKKCLTNNNADDTIYKLTRKSGKP